MQTKPYGLLAAKPSRETELIVSVSASDTLVLPLILGSAYDDVSPGVLHFDHRGRAYTMHPTGADAAHMSLIFGDTTNGDDTYGGGRFLSVPAPDADGTLWLDFNRAYNPPCAFSPYTTCPLPPPGNRLAVAVEAGERTPPEPERSP